HAHVAAGGLLPEGVDHRVEVGAGVTHEVRGEQADRACELRVGVEVDGPLREGVRVCPARGGAEADGGGPGRGEQGAARQHGCGPLGEGRARSTGRDHRHGDACRVESSATEHGNRLPDCEASHVEGAPWWAGRRVRPVRDRVAPCSFRDVALSTPLMTMVNVRRVTTGGHWGPPRAAAGEHAAIRGRDLTKGTTMSATFPAALSRRHVLAGMSAAGAALGLAACGGGSGGGVPESDENHKDFVMTVWGGEEDKLAYQARIDLAKEEFPDYNITLQLIP